MIATLISGGTGKFVVDASVAVKFHVEEQGRPAALALLAGDADLIAPDFIQLEFGSAMSKKVRNSRLGARDARTAVSDFLTGSALTLHSSAQLLPAALELSLRLGHPIYDCLYLALAQAEHCQMITADLRLQERVRGTALESLVVAL